MVKQLDGLVVAASVVGSAVREEPVDDEADDGEDEDEQAPEELVADGAVGLEDLDPDDNVKNQDDEAQNATACAVLPRRGRGGADGGSKGDGGEPKLEEERECGGKHGEVLKLYGLRVPRHQNF